MITRIAIELTDDERRRINRIVTGKNKRATRATVVDFVQRLVAAVVDPATEGSTAIVVEHTTDGSLATTFDPSAVSCTTLDHLYPLGPKTATTPCYCGKSAWGGVPKRFEPKEAE